MLIEALGRGFEPMWYQCTSGFRDHRLSPSLATPALQTVLKSLIKDFFIWVSIPVKIKVTLVRTNEILSLNLSKGSTGEHILKQINLKPDTVIIMNDNKPVPIDEKIKDNNEYSILQVSSGG